MVTDVIHYTYIFVMNSLIQFYFELRSYAERSISTEVPLRSEIDFNNWTLQDFAAWVTYTLLYVVCPTPLIVTREINF